MRTTHTATVNAHCVRTREGSHERPHAKVGYVSVRLVVRDEPTRALTHAPFAHGEFMVEMSPEDAAKYPVGAKLTLTLETVDGTR